MDVVFAEYVLDVQKNYQMNNFALKSTKDIQKNMVITVQYWIRIQEEIQVIRNIDALFNVITL